MDQLTALYLSMLQALLPQGRAWPREPDAELTLFLERIAEWLATAHQRGMDLLTEANPTTALETLSDWEASLGLDNAALSTSARQAAIVAALLDAGGARKERFIALAKTLGYTATIESYTVATCQSPCDAPLIPYFARLFWKLIVTPDSRPMTCIDRCDARLVISTCMASTDQLETLIRRITPAISNVVFVYGGTTE